MSTYLRLLRYLRPHLRVFGLAIGCMLFSSVLEGIQLTALYPLADRILTNKMIPVPAWLPAWAAGLVQWFNAVEPLRLAGIIAFGIPVLFFLKGLFEFWRTFFMSDTAQRVIRDLRQALFDRFTALSLDYHHRSPTGQTMSRIIYDTGIVQNSITEGLTDIFLQSFQVLIFLSIAVAISWELSLIICILVPVLGFIVSKVGKALKKYSQQSQAVIGQLNATILESIEGIQVIQAFLVEPLTRQKFAAVNDRCYRTNRKLQKRMNVLSPFTELVGAIALAFVFWFGIRKVLLEEMTLGAFLVFLGAMGSVIRPIKRLARLHGVNQQALASAERIFEVMDTPSSVLEHAKARVLPRFHREIAYEHVSFHYDAHPALRNVSLNVRFGETVALVGPSGGGKTTFVNLLPRFYEPNAGRIKVDGFDLRHVTLASLRGQIGLVTQQTFLFNDTVRANIALGNPDAEFAQIVEAAKLASAHTFISKLPKGYDTVIGERGELLSGGERQRLAIARALVKNPPILIFDEATSQLDAQSEHLIAEAIERLRQDRTVLIVAHRLSTVRLAHRIVLIQEGRIVEQGNHDELLHKSPLYRRFCELQLMHAGPKAPDGTGASSEEQRSPEA
jgi:subfamily B ATP-binding cassette protein MsbA